MTLPPASGAWPPFVLTLLSRDPVWIRAADEAGVQRIGLDLERMGKHQRQGRLPGARISDHTFDDLRALGAMNLRARKFARLNPLHGGSKDEVETALALGAQSLMLPSFRSEQDAETFVGLVAGRAEALLLLERAAAVARLDEIVRVAGVAEIMVGLNDLHLDLGLVSPMDVAGSELLDRIGDKVRAAGLRFGFGGVARPDDRDLPVPADLILARYAQVGARSAWLARSFFNGGLTPEGFPAALQALRARLDHWFAQPREALARARAQWRAPAQKRTPEAR
ncbi:MAG: aldolase [Planctomycetota bacterium]|nr:aldolase [Planctomycetota bacterium]